MDILLSGGRTATFKTLNARESMKADAMIPEGANQAIYIKTYAIAAVREIDGKPTNALSNKTEFDAFAETLTLGDLVKITEALKAAEDITGDELKNELSATTSEA